MTQLPGGRIAGETIADTLRLGRDAARLLVGPSMALSRAGRSGNRAKLHEVERAWARRVVRTMGIDFLSHVPDVDRTPHLVAPLHEGFADIVALLHLPLDLTFVARAELADWSLLGRTLRATDQILFDPERARSTMRAFQQKTHQAVSRGESIVIFPQGTILGVETAFTGGPDWLADHLGIPILPVVLAGSHRVWEWPFSPIARYGQPMWLEALPPIPAGALAGLASDMRRRALENGHAPVRHFDPDRDGYWDGYSYEIDDAFSDLAEQVRAHRDR